jgi:two-component system, cell cycle response regulator DivK
MGDSDRHPTVLVIEDDQAARKLYAEMLRDEGFVVAEAHNGWQAVEKAAELLPEVIVTDLGLPGIDGFEVCRRIHHDERTKHIPLVAITGRYVGGSDMARAQREGCHAVLVKPLDAEHLIAEVRSVLQTNGEVKQDPECDS